MPGSGRATAVFIRYGCLSRPVLVVEDVPATCTSTSAPSGTNTYHSERTSLLKRGEIHGVRVLAPPVALSEIRSGEGTG